jgi:hypothetical protein
LEPGVPATNPSAQRALTWIPCRGGAQIDLANQFVVAERRGRIAEKDHLAVDDDVAALANGDRLIEILLGRARGAGVGGNSSVASISVILLDAADGKRTLRAAAGGGAAASGLVESAFFDLRWSIAVPFATTSRQYGI